MEKMGMNRWVRRLFGSAVFVACFILGVSQACAVALGKIEVASHLGEVFFAEVPLQLEENESISSVFVELAAPAEYRILEVYRDPSLNVIHSDIKKDSRGARVELSSGSVIDAPFFNLILKVRHGHATQFKKYPVFLDLMQVKSVQAKALPEVSSVNSHTSAGQHVQLETTAGPARTTVETGTEKPAFKLYDGWARTGRYGPMVYGDTIRTVAIRLRVNERYTLAQVMMALFNKNRKKFAQGNINLINAGTWLDVPRASEVEELTPPEASKLLARHKRAWETLKKKPHYTAIAEAQKNRYKTRVRVGKMASGVASSPVPGATAGKRTGKSAAKPAPKITMPDATQQKQLDALQQENAALKEKLKAADDRMDALSDKLAGADVTAANARIKKLELNLARLQAELDRSRQEAKSSSGVSQWLTYLLGGLAILLLASLGYLLRRERPHPAAASISSGIDAVTPPLLPSREGAASKPGEFARETPAYRGLAEDEPGQATMQMHARGAEDVFTDTAPNLTESGVAEAGMSQEMVEETLDPNVDYIAEADIYLRYGMEDEAVDQIRMAIEQRPDNADAHIKLIQTLRSKGDQPALDTAIEAGRRVLSGEGLQAFEAAVSPEDEGEAGIDLGSALPPVEFEIAVSSESEQTAMDKSGEGSGDVSGPVGEIDMMEAGSPENTDEKMDEGLLKEAFELLDRTTVSRKEDGESMIGEETDQQDEMKSTAKSSPEAGSPESGVFDLEIQPAVDGENEGDTAGDLSGRESTPVDMDTGMTQDAGIEQDSLSIDKARSLLAEGVLDEAESLFRADAEAGNKRGDALLGLADVARKRGDTAKAVEFLAEAEALVNDGNRDWFESIRHALDQ